MGYTHYFTKKELEHDLETWSKFVKDVKSIACKFDLSISNVVAFSCENKVTKEIPVKIGDGSGEGKPAEFSSEAIDFNGVGEESHENVLIFREHSEKDMTDWQKDRWENNTGIFGFTKTSHKPYDILVTATLALYKHHFKDKVEISSDGGHDGFLEGLALVKKYLGYSLNPKDILSED